MVGGLYLFSTQKSNNVEETSSSTIQIQIEKKYEKGIFNALSPLLGEKNFKVSVQVKLRDRETVEESTNLIPQQVSELKEQGVSSNTKTTRHIVPKKKTTPVQNESNMTMPGFPIFNTNEEVKNIPETESSSAENSSLSTEKKTSYFYQSRTNRSIIPASQLGKITVRILVNQTKLESLGIEKKDIQKLLSEYLNINNKNPIDLKISELQFKGNIWDISEAIMKLQLFFRLKGWPLWAIPFGLFGIGACASLLFGLLYLYEDIQNKRQFQKLNINRIESEKKEKRKVSYREKSQILLEVAKSKPKVIARCIESMVETNVI